MKNILIAVAIILLITAQPAEAARSRQAVYKTYHLFVYWPATVCLGLCNLPVTVLSHAVQHFDDLLKQDADDEAAGK